MFLIQLAIVRYAIRNDNPMHVSYYFNLSLYNKQISIKM